MNKINLDNRLESMADLVRQGAVFADIGTDHGYLPVFLLLSGRIDRAILTDVNEGPLSTALATVKEYGLESKVKLVLADGLAGLEEEGITDVSVCGMGGELILRIISDADFLRREGVRLILQPMTRQASLRARLYELGFQIVSERYSFSHGKYYLGIAAEYSGVKKELTAVEAELGFVGFLEKDREAYLGYMRAKALSYEKAILGKRTAGEETSGLEGLLSVARKLIADASNE